MSQKRQYKSYSAEFKEEAVELVTGQGYSVAEAAASPGVRTKTGYQQNLLQSELVPISLRNQGTKSRK